MDNAKFRTPDEARAARAKVEAQLIRIDARLRETELALPVAERELRDLTDVRNHAVHDPGSVPNASVILAQYEQLQGHIGKLEHDLRTARISRELWGRRHDELLALEEQLTAAEAANTASAIVRTDVPRVPEVVPRERAIRAEQRMIKTLDWFSALVRGKIADEEIGDALERIAAQVRNHCSPAWVYLKAFSTMFWVLWHLALDAYARANGKHKGE